MKVFEINSVCGYGSTGRIAVSLYREIEKSGGKCKIAYGRKETSFEGSTYKIGSKVSSYLHVLGTRAFDRHGFYSKKATKDLIEEIEKFAPDIIHLHNIHGYYLHIEILFNYLKKKNLPVVWTFHDCWPFTGHCAYFTKAECERWKNGCTSCPQKGEYPRASLIDSSKRNYRDKKKIFTGLDKLVIVTPSKWLKGLVEESFLGDYRVGVVNNGIDLSVFKYKKSDFKDKYKLGDKYLILGVASVWDERKGLNYFVELSERLDERFQIAVVGVSKNQKQSLPKNIIAIERTDSVEELVEIYSAADLFVNPTLEDNFPTTNLEAMACATPVLTFETGGSAECIDSSCGFSVKTGDLEGLLSVIESLEFTRIKKEDCLKKSREYLDSLKFKEYIELYRALIEGVGDE